MKKECKRHRWRVGSGNGIIHKREIKTESLNIWCERCGKSFKAYYYTQQKLNKMKKDLLYTK
jgi:hypothetical protein